MLLLGCPCPYPIQAKACHCRRLEQNMHHCTLPLLQAKRRSSSSPVTSETLCRRCLCPVAIRHVRTRQCRCCHLSSLTQRDGQRLSREIATAKMPVVPIVHSRR
ncbi:hypothetical protein PIB30_026262 [Stylosanthes scabra]|uniref:Uncharacterized protein n=1 Tax=Stylosanthes scabra TaxID=79078 RepID=A0ABU6SBN2_9FABA|nr:hypothetical protein [Stylosanthes scabra]